MNPYMLRPTCSAYLKDDSGKIEYSEIFSIVWNAITQKPTNSFTKEDVFDILSSAEVFSPSIQLQDLQIRETTCLQVIKKYQCNFLCPVCPLSPLYKNANDKEEANLLSFALKRVENYTILKACGVTSMLFRSLLLVNTTPKTDQISTLPLNKYFFDYIAESTSPYDNIIYSFLRKFATQYEHMLDKDSLFVIEKYLRQLQEKEDIHLDIIQKILNSHFQISTPKVEIKIEEPKEINDSKQSTCISGFLDTIPVVDTKGQKVGVENKPKTVTIEETIPSAKQTIKEKKSINSILPKQKDSSYSLPTSEMNYSYLFSLSEAHPNIVDTNQKESLCLFQRFLLLNLELAVEVIKNEENKEEYLLFYAANKFYAINTNDKGIAKLLFSYLSYSKIRRLICFDPFRLYRFLFLHLLPNHSVYSIRTAHTLLAKAQNREYRKTPEQVLKEIASRSNENQVSFYAFAMPLYRAIYLTIEKNSKDIQQQVFQQSKINALLGISFYLSETTEDTTELFEYNKNLELSYHYRKETKMKPDYIAIAYTFEIHQGNLSFFLLELLTLLSASQLIQQCFYRLLSLTTDTILFAIHKTDNHHFRDLLFRLSSFAGEKLKVIPVQIKERKINSSIEC